MFKMLKKYMIDINLYLIKLGIIIKIKQLSTVYTITLIVNFQDLVWLDIIMWSSTRKGCQLVVGIPAKLLKVSYNLATLCNLTIATLCNLTIDVTIAPEVSLQISCKFIITWDEF